jgi:16S rRNA (adenine1518-N6/adenine1519-N6)-dimethyltransferase
VVANLPYNVGTALLVRWLGGENWPPNWTSLTLMFQLEVAQRIVAPPGGGAYGRLAVPVAQHAEARILFHVRPGSFHPAPAVTSSVIGLTPRAAPLAPVRDAALFEAVVKQAFATRRKMLRGALAASFDDDAVAAALAASGIDGTKRAEQLSVADFARLANALAEARPAGAPTGRAPLAHLPRNCRGSLS